MAEAASRAVAYVYSVRGGHDALVRLHGVLFLKEINAFFIGPREGRELDGGA